LTVMATIIRVNLSMPTNHDRRSRSPYADQKAGTLTTVGSKITYQTETTSTGELTIRDSLVFRHSDSADFDSDWGIVSLSNGRVVGVEFSPD